MGSLYTALVLVITSAFTSATILPGSSEIVLVAFLEKYPDHIFLAWVFASIGNSLGGAASFCLGRLLPLKKQPSQRIQRSLKKYGSSILLFSWIPFLGDALPVAAGWLRLPVISCMIYLFIGKTFRYAAIILVWIYGGSDLFHRFM